MRTLSGLLLALITALTLGGCGSATDTGGGESAASKDTLTLTGAIKADSSAEQAGGGCKWRPSDFGLQFVSGPMQGGVVVAFSVTVGIGGLGDESAIEPLDPSGNTPLYLKSGGRNVKATAGTVHVTEADLGARKWKGTVEGDFADGTHLTGGWTCQASI